MNLALSDDQILLRDSVARFLADKYGFAQRRAALAAGGWQPDVWQEFAELGLLGAALPADVGGLDGGPEESMLICEEFGKSLVLEPYRSCVVLGASLLRDGGASSDAMLRGLAAGSILPAPALHEPGTRYALKPVRTRARRSGDYWMLDGAKSVVIGAPQATHLLVSATTSDAAMDGDVSLFAVPSGGSGVRRRDYRLIDGRPCADIDFQSVRVDAGALIGEQGRAMARIDHAVDVAIAALCAEALGVMRILLSSTLDYARQRQQFGRPIASFQALQHRMADMYTRIERAHSMVLMATMALGLPDAERRRSISASIAFIANALRFTSESAVQTHGGIGTTDEMAISHYFKRATVLENEFGNADVHLRRMSNDMG